MEKFKRIQNLQNLDQIATEIDKVILKKTVMRVKIWKMVHKFSKFTKYTFPKEEEKFTNKSLTFPKSESDGGPETWQISVD